MSSQHLKIQRDFDEKGGLGLGFIRLTPLYCDVIKSKLFKPVSSLCIFWWSSWGTKDFTNNFETYFRASQC